jgi:SAM-dependent methyltransferase
MSQLYHDTIVQLRECYDTHAHKFSSTRKKHWPEVEWIVEKLRSEEVEKWKNIVELWCGDGRLWTALSEQGIAIQHYHGVDISEELITQARQRSSGQKQVVWEVNDMLSELKTMASESCDVVIAMASFQHLPGVSPTARIDGLSINWAK